MKKICQIICGSTLYGLDTPESDKDVRGVFINTDPSKILGLGRGEIIKENSEDDNVFFELVHYLKGLRKTNTQFLEILFAPKEKYDFLSEEFLEIKKNQFELIDSNGLYCSLLGYIENEKKLANGERTGKLGGKRRKSLEKYGFSPKNFSHLLRLSFCGKIFFETGYYPVMLNEYDPATRDLIYSIKTEPEKYDKQQLNDLANKFLNNLKNSYKNKQKTYIFNENLANKLCLKFYINYLR